PQPMEQPAPEKKPPRGGEESTGGGLWGDVT
ncbi:Sec-independent protein translocase TatB, partial [Salmonella enterica subsp. enterica serovar Panama]